mgnify:CR=1 FL=1
MQIKLVLLILSIIAFAQAQLGGNGSSGNLGGYSSASNSDCKAALDGYLGNNRFRFGIYSILSCHIQPVSGLNFMMQLRFMRRFEEIRCYATIYRNIGREYSLNLNGPSGCAEYLPAPATSSQ